MTGLLVFGRTGQVARELQHLAPVLAVGRDAADLAQDTFIRVLTARDAASVEPIHEPRAFLRTVAGRLLSNHLRRRSLELAWQQTLASLPARGGCSCSPNPKD